VKISILELKVECDMTTTVLVMFKINLLLQGDRELTGDGLLQSVGHIDRSAEVLDFN